MAELESATVLAFWDLAECWSRETGAPLREVVTGLARAVIYDGLLTNSVEAASIDLEAGTLDFRGDPFVGYRAAPESPIMILRNTALRHLVAVARDGAEPRRAALAQEMIRRRDFRAWLTVTGRPLPAFWFAGS